MKSATHKIIGHLNEAIDSSVLETESTVGQDEVVEVKQCPDCKQFFLGGSCPVCGTKGTVYGVVTAESDDAKDDRVVEEELEVDVDKEEEEEKKFEEDEDEEKELTAEEEVVMDEALKTLTSGNYKKFNESYSDITSLNKKGELVFAFESCKVTRKMTSRQKAIYNLSEKMNSKVTTKRSAKNESIKVARQELLIKNESRAIRIAAARILERQGAKYDFTKFTESLNSVIKKRNESLRARLEGIQADEVIGKEELSDMAPDEVANTVASVIEDTGLAVLDKSADIDDETAVVSVRVEDTPEAEISVNEIKAVLSDIFDAPIEVEGPALAEGDESIADLEIIINPENDEDEEEDGEKMTESEEEDPRVEVVPQEEINPEMKEGCEDDEEKKVDECDDTDKKFESRRSHRFYVLAESKSLRTGRVRYLKEDESESTDDEEDTVKVFVDKDSAEDYMKENDLEDTYVPVPITVSEEDKDEKDLDEYEEIEPEPAIDVEPPKDK